MNERAPCRYGMVGSAIGEVLGDEVEWLEVKQKRRLEPDDERPHMLRA